MTSAFLYLQLTSVANAVVQRVRRLRQPKYLIGALVGAAYFYFFFFRNFQPRGGRHPAPALPVDFAPFVELFAAFALFLVVALAWIFGKERAALQFSEAEVVFLFPAPVSRRALIHFKLLRSQLGILFTALFFTLLSHRFRPVGGSAWTHALGWWLVLSTLNLHQIGASFARERLLDLGVNPARRRALAAGLLTLLGAATWWWLRRALAALPAGAAPGELLVYAQTALSSGPLAWLLAPFRLVVRPFFAAGAGGFLLAAGPALLLLAAHYFWVVRSDVAFEEASLELAQKRAERVAAMREGKWRAGRRSAKAARPPFALTPRGPAAPAFLWKNLLAAGSMFRPKVWFGVAVAVVVVGSGLKADPAYRPVLGVIGSTSLAILAWITFFGPQVLRYDLRHDLTNADILKVYPLRGWQIVLGELLTPVVILTGLQWLLLLAAALTIPSFGRGAGLDPVLRTTLAACCALLAPCVSTLMLMMPNAATLLFPAWAQPGQRQGGGLELMGQRLILMAGQMLVFVVATLPAAVVGTFVFVFGRMLLGDEAALLLATVFAAVPLVVEAGLVIWWLGERFEAFDLSAELPR